MASTAAPIPREQHRPAAPAPAERAPARGPEPAQGTVAGLPLYLRARAGGGDPSVSPGADPAPEGVIGVPSAEGTGGEPVGAAPEPSPPASAEAAPADIPGEPADAEPAEAAAPDEEPQPTEAPAPTAEPVVATEPEPAVVLAPTPLAARSDGAAAAGAEGAEAVTEAFPEAPATAGEPAAGDTPPEDTPPPAPDEAPGAGAAPPPARRRGGGGGAPPGLAAWRSSVQGATTAVPQPGVPDAAPATGAIATAGTTAAEAHRTDAAAVPAEGAAQLPESREPIPETPPETDPPPDGAALVEAAAQSRLADYVPPPFERSPRGFMPVMGARPVPAEVLRQLVETPPAPVSDPSDPERTRLEEMRVALLEPTLTPEQASGVPSPVVDTEPPPPEPLPESTAAEVGRVLAHLLADPQGEARQMLARVRGSYANGALQEAFPTLGDDDLLPDLAADLERQLRAIAEEAGVAAETLEQAVSDRRSVLEERRRVAESEISSTTAAYCEQVSGAGQETLDAVAGTRRQLDAAADSAQRSAGAADPAAIRRRRDQLIADVNARAASARVAYRDAGDRRNTELDGVASGQAAAYRAAAQQDELRLRTDGSDRGDAATDLLVTESRDWATRRSDLARRAVEGGRRASAAQVTALQGSVDRAAADAREQLRDWSDRQTGTRRSWWERLMDWIGDWMAQARANAEAWERARNQRTGRAIAANLEMMRGLEERARTGIDAGADAGATQLDEEQQAVVAAYFAAGPDQGDTLAAVAAGTRVRIFRERREAITTSLEERLLRDDVDARALERVGKGFNPAFNAAHIADELHHAMFGGLTGWGTDEAQIFGALAGLNRVQGVAVRRMYGERHGRNLDEDLVSELSDADLDRARAQLTGDSTRVAVAELRQAMEGWGTDEDAIMRALRGRSDAEREEIRRIYRETYGVDLDSELRDELSSRDLDRAGALLEGDTARADAIALQQAMEGLGTDEAAIESVYARIRDDVRAEADAQGWTTAQMEAEIARRGREVERTFNARFGREWSAGEGSALRAAFGEELSGGHLALANALADNDLVRADAARLAIEQEAVFVTDDQVVQGVLRAQYERSLEELRRDRWGEIQRAIDAEAPPGGWDPYQRAERERRALRALEAEARTMASGRMTQLESTFDREHGAYGTGSLRVMIAFNTSGTDRERAQALLESGGHLTPAQEIRFAVQGVGTEEDAIRRALEGRTAEEVAEIEAEYRRLTGGEDMRGRLESELGGRDWLDVRIALQGVPENEQQEMAQLRERVEFERQNTSAFGGSHQRRLLESDFARAEADFQAVLAAPPGERNRLLGRFQQSVEHTRVSVASVQRQNEAMVDALSTAAAITAAVVVGVAGAIFTGGASAAVALAVIASIASTASSMAIRAAMTGAAYTLEDMGVDLAVGVVDAVVAAATAGLGNRLLGMRQVAQGASKGGGMLARFGNVGGLARALPASETLTAMARSGSRSSRMMAHLLAEGIEEGISNLPSAAVGNLLNDRNWEQGNAFQNILLGTLLETGQGMALGMGMGRVMSGAGSAYRYLRPGEVPLPTRFTSPDSPALHPTPEQRLAAWREYQEMFPGRSHDQFAREFDAVLGRHRAEAQAQHDFRRNARRELLEGLPPAQRGGFADVPVHQVSAADFRRLAPGQPGPAAVVVRDGQVHVVLREGGDPGSLRALGADLPELAAAGTGGRTRNPAEALPPDLRNRVPVETNPALAGDTVRVHYDVENGVVRGIRIEAGPGARAADIRMHAETVRLMRRYAGLSGRIRAALDGIAARFGRGGPPVGSRAWEARLELEKLPRIIEERMARLAAVGTDARARAELEADVAHLRAQLDAHAAALGDASAGVGFVAAEGRVGRITMENGKPVLTMVEVDTPRTRAELEAELEGDAIQRIRALREQRGRLETQVKRMEAELRSVQRRQDLLDEAIELAAEQNRKPYYRIVEERARLELVEAELRTRIEDARAEHARVRDQLAETSASEAAKSHWSGYRWEDLGTGKLPCFPAGTTVWTPDGERPIETLAEGDPVLAYDEGAGAVLVRRVTSVHRNRTRHLVDLTVGEETLSATRSHPFWDVGTGEWRAARSLRAGGLLRTPTGETVEIGARSTRVGMWDTFNLEVEGSHTYFVGGAGVLVHNGDGGETSGWASTDRRLTRIYAVVDLSTGQVVYVGKTYQGESPGDVEARFRQHVGQKADWRGTQLQSVMIEGAEGRWSRFETAVWEQHYINLFGGARSQGGTLWNDIRAITPEAFREYGDPRHGQDPCR